MTTFRTVVVVDSVNLAASTTVWDYWFFLHLLLLLIAFIFHRDYAEYIHGEEKKNHVQTTSDHICRSSDYD